MFGSFSNLSISFPILIALIKASLSSFHFGTALLSFVISVLDSSWAAYFLFDLVLSKNFWGVLFFFATSYLMI